MLCLKCGKKEQFADNLCEDCLLETVRPVQLPNVVQYTSCSLCGRVLKGKTWVDPSGELPQMALALAAENIITLPEVTSVAPDLSIVRYDKNVFFIEGRVRSKYKGVLIYTDVAVEVRFSFNTCPWCSRQRGSYFEAILQVRGLRSLTEEERDSVLSSIRDEAHRASVKDPNIFITKEEEVRGGYDFYLGSSAFARQTAQKLHERFGGEHKATSSQFGIREGKEVHRSTYLVRLPDFVEGDYVMMKDGPYRVVKTFKRVTLRSLRTANEVTLDWSDAMELRVLKRNEVEHELVFVSETERELQVLHPRTMLTVDVVKPEGYVKGEKLKAALIENELFLVS